MDETTDDGFESQQQQKEEARNLAAYKRALGLQASGDLAGAASALQTLLRSPLLARDSLSDDDGASPSRILAFAAHKVLADVLARTPGERDAAQALAHAEAAAALDGTDGLLWHALGTLAARAGRSETARAALLRARELLPAHWPTAGALLDVLFASGDLPACAALAAECQSLRPIAAKALLLRAHILDLAGRASEAAALRRAAESECSPRDVAEAAACVQALAQMGARRVLPAEDTAFVPRPARMRVLKAASSPPVTWMRVCDEVLRFLKKSPLSFDASFGGAEAAAAATPTMATASTQTTAGTEDPERVVPRRHSARKAERGLQKRESEIEAIVARFGVELESELPATTPSPATPSLAPELLLRAESEAGEVRNFLSATSRSSIETLAFNLLEALFASNSVIWDSPLKECVLELHSKSSKRVCIPAGRYFLALAELLVDGFLSADKQKQDHRDIEKAQELCVRFVAAFGTNTPLEAARVLWLKARIAIAEKDDELKTALLYACESALGSNEIRFPFCKVDPVLNNRVLQLKVCVHTSEEGTSPASSPLPLAAEAAAVESTNIAQMALSDRTVPQRLPKLQELKGKLSRLGRGTEALDCICEILGELDPKDSGDAELLLQEFRDVQILGKDCQEKLPEELSKKLLRVISDKLRRIETTSFQHPLTGSAAQMLFEGFLAFHSVFIASFGRGDKSLSLLREMHRFFGAHSLCTLRDGKFLFMLFEALTDFSPPRAGLFCSGQNETDENFFQRQERIGLSMDVWIEEMGQVIACITEIKPLRDIPPHKTTLPPLKLGLKDTSFLAKVFFFLRTTANETRSKTDLSKLFSALLAAFPLQPGEFLPFSTYIEDLLSGRVPPSSPLPQAHAELPKLVSFCDYTKAHLHGMAAHLIAATKVDIENGSELLENFLRQDLGANPTNSLSWRLLAKSFRSRLFKLDLGPAEFKRENDAAICCLLQCRRFAPDVVSVTAEIGFHQYWQSRLSRHVGSAESLEQAEKCFASALEADASQWVWMLMLGRCQERLGKIGDALHSYLQAVDLSKQKKVAEPLFRLHVTRMKRALRDSSISDQELALLENSFFRKRTASSSALQEPKGARCRAVVADATEGLEHALKLFRWHHKSAVKLARFYLQDSVPPRPQLACDKLSSVVRPMQVNIFDLSVRKPESESEELLIGPGEDKIYKRKVVGQYVAALRAASVRSTLLSLLPRIEEDPQLSDVGDKCWISLSDLIGEASAELRREAETLFHQSDMFESSPPQVISGELATKATMTVPMDVDAEAATPPTPVAVAPTTTVDPEEQAKQQQLSSKAETLLHEAYVLFCHREKHPAMESERPSDNVLVQAFITFLACNPDQQQQRADIASALAACQLKWPSTTAKRRQTTSLASITSATVAAPPPAKKLHESENTQP